MLQTIATPPDPFKAWTAPACADARGCRGDVHDLGNLLQVASCAVSLLERHQRRTDSTGGEPFLSGARDALQQAMLVARRLLDGPSQIEAAQDQVAVSGVVERAAWRARTLAPAGIRIEQLAVAPLIAVGCNRQRLEDAVLNLVCNSIRAVKERGCIRIGATVEKFPGTLERVRIFIEDDGDGVDDTVMARPFAAGVSSKAGGSGLGLSGVAEFARAAGGEVLLSTIRGQGTRVAIILPTRNLGREP